MAMAHHKQTQGSDTSSSGGSASLRMEDEEELAIIQHGGTLSAEDQTKPPSMTSCLLPARSLRSTASAIVVPVPVAQVQEGDLGIRSLSFSKLLSFRMARALSSLSRGSDSILDHDASNSSALTLEKEDTKELELKQVCRSLSVPTSVRRLRRVVAADSTSSSHWRLRVVPDLVDPHPTTEAAVLAPTGEEEEEDIAAEEAVCRICMVALSEEAVLKLECCCKGELALAHRGCAIKWFSIKGNGTCDVCGQEVLNLPVTLRRLSSIQAAVAQAQGAQQQQQQHAADDAAAAAAAAAASRRYRIMWHGTPILVIISMLAYFCFLEQLLVGDHGTAALAISLPFACVLGLFSSLTITKMVSRRYVWIYAALQFLFIVLFTHLFYRYVRMQAVIAIILSTFAGFSVAICTNYFLLQILRWRARHHVASPTTTTAGEQGHGSREPSAVDLELALPPP